MTKRKIDTITQNLTQGEKVTLNRLVEFALRNNLDLFNVKGSLQDRVQTITRNNGMCPCFREQRPHCPCKECLQEVRERGECGCRLFIARRK